MKHIIIIVACMLLTAAARSQSLTYYSGALIEHFDDIPFSLFQQDEKQIYAYNYIKPGYYIDVFDKDSLKRTAHIRIPLPSKDSIKFTIENLLPLPDRFLAFYSWFDKASQQIRLEMIPFNEKGERVGDVKLIDTLSGKSQRKAGSFTVSNRAAENRFVSYGFKRVKNVSYINIDFFDYSGNKIKTQDFNIDNEGLLVHSFFDDESIYRLQRSKMGNRNVKWTLDIYSPSSTAAHTIHLEQADRSGVYLSNMFDSYSDSSSLYLLSPYTTTALAKKAEGVYLAKVNLKTHALEKESVIPFKEGAVSGSTAADFSLSSCVLTGIIPLSGGGLRALFESRLMTTSYGVPASYSMGDIIAVDISGDYDAVSHINVIGKRQVVNPQKVMYTGFTTLTRNDSTFFIYNELPENLQRPESGLKNVRGAKLDETVVIYASTAGPGVTKNILIEKPAKAGIDAIMPRTVLRDRFRKGVIYLLRKKGEHTFLTKISG